MSSPLIWAGRLAKILNAGIQFTDQGSDPATPASGTQAVYSKSAGLFIKNSSGTVAQLGGTAVLDGPSYNTDNALATSVAANALTIALKDKTGADATASTPITWAFRNTTAATGTYSTVSVTGALSVVVPSGATLGQTSTLTYEIYVYALNNAGTIELAVSSTLQDERRVATTTAIGAGSTSFTGFYSTSARTGVAIRFIGKLTNTQTTAGTWAVVPTNTDVQVLGNSPATASSAGLWVPGATAGTINAATIGSGFIGQIIQAKNINQTVSTNTNLSNISVTPGVWLITAMLTFNNTPTTVCTGSISTSSGVMATNDGSNYATVGGASQVVFLNIPNYYVNINSTTSFFFVVTCSTTQTSAVAFNFQAVRIA